MWVECSLLEIRETQMIGTTSVERRTQIERWQTQHIKKNITVYTSFKKGSR